MLFNSVEYLLFLPITFLLYWFAFRKSLQVQNLFIVIASYIFYCWWYWRFSVLIAFTTLCSFLSGRLVDFLSKKSVPYFSNYQDIHFLNSKELLAPRLANGEKDIYLCNDTHWSIKRAKYVAEELKRRIEEQLATNKQLLK